MLAEIREIERDKLLGQLLPAADVRNVWSERLAALKDRVLMLSEWLAARLANRNEAEICSILRDELETCLRGIHDDGQKVSS